MASGIRIFIFSKDCNLKFEIRMSACGCEPVTQLSRTIRALNSMTTEMDCNGSQVRNYIQINTPEQDIPA
jgi:hypothetical protein